jgi:methylmalonyl-CoA mutase N-terminal domain/subunit
MGYDEAYELPTEDAVTLSLRTQQIIALESGVTRTADPLAGSFYVEWLTDELERRAREVMAQVEDAGGAVAALASGLPQRWIAGSAYQTEKDISSGRRSKVGVNVYLDEGEVPELRLFHLDPLIGERQVRRLQQRRAGRDAAAVGTFLSALAGAAAGGDNVMPALIEASRAGATMGEMAGVFRAAFGEFKEPALW